MKARKPILVAVLSAALLGACAGAGTRTGVAVDDTVITTKVKSALLADTRVSGMNVRVDTVEGRVMLSGVAKTPAERQAASDVARSVAGVRQVENRIVVQGG
jgi:hyperosmotically inducible protein